MPKNKTSARQLDREIAQALTGRSSKKTGRRVHATKAESSTRGRWIHKDVARSYSVPEDVVRRIYVAVQTAKRQGLYGGYYLDLLERSVGRKLVGAEYTVSTRAKEHLGYDPPSGYSGPKPTGWAKEPQLPKYGDPKVRTADPIRSSAERTIKDVLGRRKRAGGGWDESNASKDRELLRRAAEELDVAADIIEEAGSRVWAGTLRERAQQARRGDYRLLDAYN